MAMNIFGVTHGMKNQIYPHSPLVVVEGIKALRKERKKCIFNTNKC